MDTHSSRPWRRLVAALTTFLVVALGAVVPLLDGDRARVGAALEAEHHGSCVVVHDHTICTQIGANLALIPETPGPRRLPVPVHAERPPVADGPSAVELDGTHLPRAPPSPRAQP